MTFLMIYFVCSVVASGYLEEKYKGSVHGLLAVVCYVVMSLLWPIWIGKEIYKHMHPGDVENPSADDKEGES